MIISWRFFLKFFFLVINVFVAHAMEDFSLPSVGLENGVVVPTSPPSVPVDALKEIFSGLASSSSGGGESISYVILKGFAGYIPPLIIGGGVTYLGAIAVKMAVNKIKTSFQNLLDTERVKKIDDGVTQVGEKLENHIGDFVSWKKTFLERMAEVETMVFLKITDFVNGLVEKLFQPFAQEQKEAIAQVLATVDETKNIVVKIQTDLSGNTEAVKELGSQVSQLNEDIGKKINLSEEKHANVIAELTKNVLAGNVDNKENFTRQEKQLADLNISILELCDRFEGVPNQIDEVGIMNSAILGQTERIEQQTSQTNKTLFTMTGGLTQANPVSHRPGAGLEGSGTFSKLIRPELNKMSAQIEELQAKLSNRNHSENQISREAIAQILGNQQRLEQMLVEQGQERFDLLENIKQELAPLKKSRIKLEQEKAELEKQVIAMKAVLTFFANKNEELTRSYPTSPTSSASRALNIGSSPMLGYRFSSGYSNYE